MLKELKNCHKVKGIEVTSIDPIPFLFLWLL